MAVNDPQRCHHLPVGYLQNVSVRTSQPCVVVWECQVVILAVAREIPVRTSSDVNFEAEDVLFLDLFNFSHNFGHTMSQESQLNFQQAFQLRTVFRINFVAVPLQCSWVKHHLQTHEGCVDDKRHVKQRFAFTPIVASRQNLSECGVHASVFGLPGFFVI